MQNDDVLSCISFQLNWVPIHSFPVQVQSATVTATQCSDELLRVQEELEVKIHWAMGIINNKLPFNDTGQYPPPLELPSFDPNAISMSRWRPLWKRSNWMCQICTISRIIYSIYLLAFSTLEVFVKSVILCHSESQYSLHIKAAICIVHCDFINRSVCFIPL